MRDALLNFTSSLPNTICLSAMVVLAPHGEVEKALPVERLATHKLLVSVDDVVGLATTLADKYMATVLLNCVLVKCWKRLESLVTDITVVNLISVLCFDTTLVPSSNNMYSLTNPPLTPAGPGASR